MRILIFILIISFSAFSQTIENLPREKSPALENRWEVVPTLKSIQSHKFKGKKSEIHHQTAEAVYLNRTRNKTKQLLLLENEDESFVVYNSKRKETGTISGALLMTLGNINDLASIAKTNPIKIIRVEKKISFAIVKVKIGYDIATVLSNLKTDPRVKSIELEVMSTNIPIAQ